MLRGSVSTKHAHIHEHRDVLLLRLVEVPGNVHDLLVRWQPLVNEQQTLFELLLQQALARDLQKHYLSKIESNDSSLAYLLAGFDQVEEYYRRAVRGE